MRFHDIADTKTVQPMRRLALAPLLMLLLVTAGKAAPQSALELYQRGLVQEQATGNLTDAIALFREAAQKSSTDRSLAAWALIHAAGAYEKLGNAAASGLYAEIVRTYPEQREQVALAQSRLTALKGASARLNAKSGAPARGLDLSTVFDPLFETYCIACHNQKTKSAGLALDNLTASPVSENTEVWEKILRRLRARRDPPLGMRRPDEAVYQNATSAAEFALDHAYPVNSSLTTAGRVSGAELAARMARFIWNASPDAALSDAAQKGTLNDPAVLDQQVRRMLRDPRSSGLVTNFFGRWLPWDSLGKDRGIDDGLRQAFETETRLFLESQIREDHNALDLWTANYSFLNDRLAGHYGISGVSGSEFRRVTFSVKTRGGLLGQGSFLKITSDANRTSPVQRGKLILWMFFGVDPPAPPPNVPPIKNNDDRPMRERMEAHRTNPACNSCHMSFEPLGLALENFNSAGQWRTTDAGVPIDASGTFVDGTKFNGPVELRTGLLKYREAFYASITEKLFGYALGREGRAWRVYDYEMPSVRLVLREASAKDYRWSSIVAGIVKSTPFQMKTIVP
jgi:Protein of unknown function (DUF1592)/Protein of unknown function (DUF1588)/Protein of unknown function (DUF1585)